MDLPLSKLLLAFRLTSRRLTVFSPVAKQSSGTKTITITVWEHLLAPRCIVCNVFRSYYVFCMLHSFDLYQACVVCYVCVVMSTGCASVVPDVLLWSFLSTFASARFCFWQMGSNMITCTLRGLGDSLLLRIRSYDILLCDRNNVDFVRVLAFLCIVISLNSHWTTDYVHTFDWSIDMGIRV